MRDDALAAEWGFVGFVVILLLVPFLFRLGEWLIPLLMYFFEGWWT